MENPITVDPEVQGFLLLASAGLYQKVGQFTNLPNCFRSGLFIPPTDPKKVGKPDERVTQSFTRFCSFWEPPVCRTRRFCPLLNR